jgi:hypothetical protein
VYYAALAMIGGLRCAKRPYGLRPIDSASDATDWPQSGKDDMLHSMIEIETVPLATAILSILAITLSVIIYFSQRDFSDTQRLQKLYERLYDFDKLVIQYPDLQARLLNSLKASGPSILGRELSPEDIKLKAFVYMHLNFFDEISLTIYTKRRLRNVAEFNDWKDYIIKIMRHPLFKQIYYEYPGIWGTSLRNFVRENEKALDEPPLPGMF